jgi:putative membrane protein
MNRAITTTMAIAAAFAFTAASSAQEQPPAQQPPRPTQNPPATMHSTKEAKSPDSTFVMKMANGGMAEVELGKLAVKNGGSQDVKSLGQRMIDDHSKAGDELKAIAERKNIAWPTQLDAKDKALHDKLAALNGDAFDRAYLNAMLSDHKKDAAELRTESKSGKDPDVKAWAAKTLPTVEDHLKQFEQAGHRTATSQTPEKKSR